MSKKEAKYQRLFSQLEALLSKETSFISQLATINAVLYHKNPGYFWIGFYFVQNGRLLVGPYQGPVACQELEYPKGVCWASVLSKEEIIVKDVESFPDHIACDSRSKSELVIPMVNEANEVVAVLDVDSDKLNNFDKTDAAGLTRILSLINTKLLNDYVKANKF
ncbi:MAG TPA: histidine kinase [Bacteroidales bacterium]|jgi:L-methionine (R)-S-oxide reductase|nr:histidine kinase [Bacteroidales bacterium]